MSMIEYDLGPGGRTPTACEPYDNPSERRRCVVLQTGVDPWRVARTQTEHFIVSTMFLGTDLSMGFGRPTFFETMSFYDDDTHDQVRTSTWAEAEAAHARVVASLERKFGLAAPPAAPASINTTRRQPRAFPA